MNVKIFLDLMNIFKYFNQKCHVTLDDLKSSEMLSLLMLARNPKEFDLSSGKKFAGGFRSLHDKVPRESETQNPRLLSQQRYDDEQFLNDHHMHSFIEGSIPDKFQNDQMIR